MAYLDNSTVTIDAILTKKGRELLSKGQGAFNITKFALADDEIDYGLWNPAHTLGSNYYGKVIEDMPLLEAVPDETQMMRSKLITMPKGQTYVLQLTVNPSGTVTLNGYGTLGTQVFTPQPSGGSLGGPVSNSTYTCTISDGRVATLVAEGSGGTGVSYVGEEYSSNSYSVVGQAFIVTARSTNYERYATLTFVGNEIGGIVTRTIRVIPEPTSVPPSLD